ncbi:HTH-type transcriptional repressor yvoA [uncultured Roseburia sp.]|uniref:GntR family transcriptional regulator n=1 Tax=Brotonthovivens ammoniilytica TaxID=2981725 RepID=A0ABT2TKJ6_9FIRM|nr:GntR family transcriptional regulator [Brotonthovivens ammoniilytica]MCU6762720.1 GntR family transcriptional regulator [Brotonthovivens ammoniilytica]SCI86014.1 HTH-type transcriptional repressor yvoA [uncultured Roseburia sp.]
MNIIITNAAGQPIYDQIVTQMKNMIMTGELKEGDALPSMRFLAKELKISVITTKRAYEELEREGFIVSYTGKGSFVAGVNQDFLREQKLKEMEECLQTAVREAKLCDISLTELWDMLKLLYEENS